MLKYGLGEAAERFPTWNSDSEYPQRAESSEINKKLCFLESLYGGRVGGWGVFSEFNGIRVRYQEFYGIVTYGCTSF